MLKLTDKQKEFWQCAHHRWNVKSGATRSGKTYLDYYLIPKRLRAVHGKEGLCVILGNTKSTLQRNIIEPLQNIWGAALVSDIRADNTAVMFGEKVHCIGADKINQVNRLRGSSIKYCYGDEVVTWHEEVFNMLKSRLDKDYSIFDGTCNPESPNHWFKRFLESDADIFKQEYTLYDNSFLPQSFIENLEREYAGTVYFDRYILGEWVRAEGLIYPSFDQSTHVLEEVPKASSRAEYYISVDYGTLNPCSMGLWRLEEDRAIRLSEVYYDGRREKRSKTDEEYYEMLAALSGSFPINRVIVDPSAASFIETIRRHGKFAVQKAKNEVLDGIRVTAALLSDNRLFFTRRCKDCVREIGTYAWDESASEDKPIKENDHAMDEMRYFCNTVARHRLRYGGI